ncbi:hypothetical protein ACIA8O_28320 [Kitasatospora sp. NPDC051853]|uniref:hypothetical protein n=1 Tax=Kitasatospora sp. NPDC051853 TaxID=3364058 RepID=UPI0037A79B06
MSWERPALVAPVLCGLYGAVRLLPEAREPGPSWLIGHALLLGSLLLFVPVLAELARRARALGRGIGRLLGPVAYVGVAASVGQVLVDLWVGAVAEDKAAMRAMFQRVQDVPGVLPALYQVGPLLFHVGLVALLCAAVRRSTWWSPVAGAAGVALAAAGLDLLPVAALLWVLALSPLERRTVAVGGMPAHGRP